MEKWTSPYLTEMSRKYCENEFILDTKHILKMMSKLNNSKTINNDSYNFFTINVEKRYPRIQQHPGCVE